MLPARSFINVGENLNQERLSHHSDGSCSPCTPTSSEDEHVEEHHVVQAKQHEQQEDAEGDNDDEGVVSSYENEHMEIPMARNFSPSSSLPSVKVEGDDSTEKRYDEETILMKKKEGHLEGATTITAAATSTEELNCYLKKKNLVLSVVLLVLAIIIPLLLRELHLGKQRERGLIQDVEKLRMERSRILQDVTSLNNDRDCSGDDESLFELENCYLNVRATASLGQCAEDLRKDAIYWYDAYSVWWDEFFGKSSSEESQADGGGQNEGVIKSEKDGTPPSSSILTNGSTTHNSWATFYNGFGFI
mmetsp:Transcript_7970/g.9940  ORF Transcript_7970/g.9940 Transcript_7970/m.9940 type:complete len:304 (+) Transcript_7970:131-1042(+)